LGWQTLGVTHLAPPASTSSLYIGLMSGTSLDGVDGVLADFRAPGLRVLGHVHRPFAATLREELLALNAPGPDELHRAALAGNALARSYAQVVDDLLRQCSVAARQVRALGAHGQTVRHRPGEFDPTGYTLQLLNGALLAELSGVDVVCDLRSRDVASGGQGAPLVPAFHAAVFGQPGQALAVLNIGGIANLSLLDADGRVRGFDCGPGNALLDHWCQLHMGQPYDDAGRWGAGGQVQAALLQALLAEPYLQRPPPKSTGRDLFNPPWLAAVLRSAGAGLAPQDVQATLAEFTAVAAARHLQQHLPAARRLLVCGGGALNLLLMQRLAALLPGVAVASTAEAGLPPLQVEAAAFAWLAQAFVQRQPGNRPEVTGAAGPRVLGALHPAA
jgi:anhydro-N-acetylmuramic acid kinase